MSFQPRNRGGGGGCQRVHPAVGPGGVLRPAGGGGDEGDDPGGGGL